jgi:hypothetical protein
MRRGLRTTLLVVAAALAIVLAATWYGRLLRCQAEIAAWAQIRAAAFAREPELLVLAREAPRGPELLDAVGVLRTEEAVRRYCDAPIWEWWR